MDNSLLECIAFKGSHQTNAERILAKELWLLRQECNKKQEGGPVPKVPKPPTGPGLTKS